ncbi:hypothetical protein FHX15_005373 [Rhizobium sp. BK650]|nr:hypothetical protein [Rhizobium sp. BK650]
MLAAPADEPHTRFEHTGRRHQPDRIRNQSLLKSDGLRLIAQDGDDRRGVDHHQFGILCSS